MNASQITVARLLGIPRSRIRVLGHYVGGSFGSKAMIHAHPALAALAADDGTAVVQAATPEFGTGVVTAMTQVAADALGLPVELCRFEGGDTALPDIAAAVGSSCAGMISAAVHSAGTALREQLVTRAVADPGSPLHGREPAEVAVRDGAMRAGSAAESYAGLLRRTALPDAEATGSWQPDSGSPYAMMTFGAQFAEVAVDPELGLVRCAG